MLCAFEDFTLDTDRRELRRDSAPVAVEPQVFDLIAFLVANRHKVVSRDDLLAAVWHGRIVSESTLTTRINAARRALGDSGEGQRLIRTIYGKGFRFVGDLVKRPTCGAAPVSPQPAVAILPFVNMSGDPQQDYFAVGLTQDIITGLSRFKSFVVIARNSFSDDLSRAVDARHVAKELGVRYVLEGSVRRAGERLRVTALLVEGSSGAHLWANRFDGSTEDIFDVQDRITESVVGVIEPQIRHAEIERSRRKRSESLDAYDLHLQALWRMDSGGAEANAEAHALWMRAVALEPNYGPFLAGAIWSLTRRVEMGWPMLTGDDRTACLDLVRRALAAAAGDPAVLAQCGYTLSGVGQDYQRGKQIIADAVEANPNNLLVLSCAAIAELHCGDLEKTLAHSRRAILMSPRTPTAYLPMSAIAHANMVLGNYEEALEAAERSLAVNPSYSPTYWMLIAANVHLGRMDEARRWLAKFGALAPGVTIARIRAGQPAKFADRNAAILDGLRRAGLEEG